jgi:hypothetical protein
MTARNERLREKQKALGLEPVQTVLHPDDKATLLEFAFQLRVRRGTLTPTDIKRVNDAATVQAAPIPIPHDDRIERVQAVVESFDSVKKTETSPRWEKAVQFIKAVKDALKNT